MELSIVKVLNLRCKLCSEPLSSANRTRHFQFPRLHFDYCDYCRNKMVNCILPSSVQSDRKTLLFNRLDYFGFLPVEESLLLSKRNHLSGCTCFGHISCVVYFPQKSFIWETYDKFSGEHLIMMTITVGGMHKNSKDQMKLTTEIRVLSDALNCGTYQKPYNYSISLPNYGTCYFLTLQEALLYAKQKSNDILLSPFSPLSRFADEYVLTLKTTLNNPTKTVWPLKKLCSFYLKQLFLYREKELYSLLKPSLADYIAFEIYIKNV
jgi:hypothetical protein